MYNRMVDRKEDLMSSDGEWNRTVQTMVNRIEECIREENYGNMTLSALSKTMGYSEFYVSRKFREISGMTLKDYIRYRRLALKDVRDTDVRILDIALKYGFSSNESFTRAFRRAYGITPREYRKSPGPLVLRTVIRPFDCYLLEGDDRTLEFKESTGEVKTYFVSIPAHRFLHIRNYESTGYWDFWQKQALIPGQDCDTVCGLLDSIPGKLDDEGGMEEDASSGQLMAWINAPEGRICSWGIPLAEAYGVRLPADWNGDVPEQMRIMDVPEGEYIVFEHGPFDFETESASVEEKIEKAMNEFDYGSSGYVLDTEPERVFYFYHDCERFWKYVRPVRKS